jgi:hypothetical protein
MARQERTKGRLWMVARFPDQAGELTFAASSRFANSA